VLAQGASSGSASDTLKLQVEIDIGTGFLGPGDHTYLTLSIPVSCSLSYLTNLCWQLRLDLCCAGIDGTVRDLSLWSDIPQDRSYSAGLG